jgi:hypothetical protein
MILGPVLLSEGVAGQAQLFTVTVYDQDQARLVNAAVTLTRTAADGSVTKLNAITDLTGVAVFSTINLSQIGEHLSTSGNVQSNAIEISPLLNLIR